MSNLYKYLHKLTISCILCIILSGCLAHAQDENKEKSNKTDSGIEYTYTKNDRIMVLSTSMITVNRRSPTVYWIMCIDGYKYIAATQNSGVALSQMFLDKNTPITCTKNDRD